MQKVAIVTDSIACLTGEQIEQYGIEIIPINFYFEGRVYRDGVDISPYEAYELFLKDPESFKTSAASAGDCLKAYREASKEAKDILCITLSSRFSTIYNAACVAKDQAKTEIPQITIEILDSDTATAAEGLIALAAARAAAEGKNLSEVIKVAREIRDKVSLIAIMDTVRYVYRTGRVPKLAASIGSILSIKPLFTISSGKVRLIRLVRNKQQSIDRLIKATKDRVGLSLVHIAVMHAYAPDEAEKLKERALAEFNCAEIWITEFSPVMGYACGTGTLGLAFYRES